MTEYDSHILTKLKTGDKKAFEEIYVKHYAELKKYAITITKDEDIAKDIISDVFFKIWTIKDSIEIKKSLKAYLFASIRYEAFKVNAKNMKNVSIDMEQNDHALDFDNTIEDNINLKDTAAKLERSIALLPSKCAQIFKMSREQEMPHKVIAEKLNISTKTVEVQIYRALKKIKMELQ